MCLRATLPLHRQLTLIDFFLKRTFFTQTEFVAFLARYSLASGIPLIECVEHLLEEATSFGEVDLALEGWKMMPLLFDEFDRDQSGSVSREELVSGIGGLIEQGGLNCDLSMVYEIMSEVDEDNDEVLDRCVYTWHIMLAYFLRAFAHIELAHQCFPVRLLFFNF